MMSVVTFTTHNPAGYYNGTSGSLILNLERTPAPSPNSKDDLYSITQSTVLQNAVVLFCFVVVVVFSSSLTIACWTLRSEAGGRRAKSFSHDLKSS